MKKAKAKQPDKRQTSLTLPMPTVRLAYSLEDFSEMFSLSYTTAYRLYKAGKLKGIMTDVRKILIPHAEVERFLAGKKAA